ncbi:flagellar basal-body rod protein FlgF [Sphingomonas vulcanisoli]|uniref:Flagellar basal-body rod protein FlgF n=1 Tax=Sphingomonas vulcanisoli TaxID=1658060 RepID=A0ABX0TTZ3_9SPHN|nr:flagellar basal-body rod protein FlgF [Sphingomonas vulcanisoli]
MDRLIYSSLAAMRGAMARQTAIASNLANANTTGFRGELTNAQALWMSNGKATDARATVTGEVAGTDMSAGPVTATGRDLDVAINGDAMLAVQGKDGGEEYTRRGDLTQNESGLLTTGDGQIVLGSSGPITLPPADKVSIAADGTISIVPQGGDPKNPQQVDKLKLVSPKGSDVKKGIDGLFQVAGGGTLPEDPDATVIAGSLEGSNVSTSSALVNMIDASRAWDGQVKMLTTAQEMDRSATDLMKISD